MAKKEYLNRIRVGQLRLKRCVCFFCKTNAMCSILRFKKRRHKWKRVWVCTECIPVRNDIIFDDDYIIIRKSALLFLVKALDYLAESVKKMGVVIYELKKKQGRIGKKSIGKIAVGFQEDEES